NTAAGQGVANSIGLVSSGASNTTGLAWTGTAQPADTGTSVSLRADSLVPAFVFVRGSNLRTRTPRYLPAVGPPGMKVDLLEVTNGAIRSLGSVTSAAYFSQQWVRLSLAPTGNSDAVQVTRADTGQYLNANGGWQTAPTNVITGTTALNPTTGFVGVGRIAQYAGP